jgi:primosomal protein N'
MHEQAERAGLNTRNSVVDLLKHHGIDSSLVGRAALSQRLGVRVNLDGTSAQNMALHAAIIRELAANNGQITTKLHTGNEHFEVPDLLSSVFTGQEDVSRRLDSSLALANRPSQPVQRRFVLFGVGGSGKTQICLKYAQAHRERYVQQCG